VIDTKTPSGKEGVSRIVSAYPPFMFGGSYRRRSHLFVS